MGRVEVPADHDGLGAAQLFGMGEERVVIAHFIGQPPVVLGSVGKVDIEKMEGGVFDVQKAAFPLITGIGEFAVHGERLEGGLLAREDRDARITLLDLRGQPFGIPALGAAVFFGDLRRLGLGFLKRHHIGVGGGEPVPVGLPLRARNPLTFHETRRMVSIVFSWQKERESVGTDQAAPAFIPMFRECGPRHAGASREARPCLFRGRIPLPVPIVKRAA